MHIKYANDIKTKGNYFDRFFPEQCTPFKNDSVLLSSQTFLTQARLYLLDFSNDKILKLIRSLNIHKAHSHKDISIRIIKICGKSLLKPLIILFQNSVRCSHYPDLWKVSNIIPLYKKITSNSKLFSNFFVINF